MAWILRPEAGRMQAAPASGPTAFGTLARYITQDGGLWGLVGSLTPACNVTKL